MKRILFYESRPEWGGAQKCELDLLVSLENDSVQTYFVSSTDGPMVTRIRDTGKETKQIPIHDSVNKIRQGQVKLEILFTILQLFRMIPHYFGVIFFILSNRIDLVYTSQFRSQLVIGWLVKLLGRKVIWHIHGEERLDNILGKLNVTFADKIVVVSNSLTERYSTLYPKAKSKFITVYNGVEPPVSNRKTPHTFTISIIGTLIEGKRQDLAISACAKLNEMGYPFHLNIIGEKPPWHSDDYKKRLQDMVEQYEISSSVSFLGWVEKPYEHLQEANVCILPSDTEGMPLSIIEAMAAGLPCISTNVGGIPELIKDGETGFIINPGNADELVEEILILMNQPSLLEQMGIQARKRYENYFTKESFIKGVAGVINTVL